MRGTHGFAFAATQTIFYRIGDCADIALLHDQRFKPHQAERSGVSRAQVGARHQFAAIETAFRDRYAVCRHENLASSSWLRNSYLVMPMPCSPEITPPRERASSHDARHGLVGFLQHLVVIGVDRQIGMHIAVTGMHVQGHKYAAAQNFFVHSLDPFDDRAEIIAFKNLL